MHSMTAEEVLTLRTGLGLTQEEFAALIGVTVASVTRWERGMVQPTRQAIAAMARLAGKDT